MRIVIATTWRVLWVPGEEQLMMVSITAPDAVQFSLPIVKIEPPERTLVDDRGNSYVLQCSPDDDQDLERVKKMQQLLFAVESEAEDLTNEVWSLMCWHRL